MSAEAEMMERHGRLLARFADQAASLADDLHACALVADTLEEKRALSIAFHRMGRALRQTLALEAKLRRDAERGAREDEARAFDLAHARRQRRKAHVKGAIGRLIWTEHERLEDADDEDAEDLIERLDLLLDAEAETEAFETEEADAVIVRLCATLGLPLQDLPPQGEVAEGRRGLQPTGASRPAFRPPQSLRDSSPCGGAADPFHPSG